MNRLGSNSRGGPAYVALASLGVMFFALVVSAYAGKDRPASTASSPVLKTASTPRVLSRANMALDNRAVGTPASPAAVAAVNGSGGGIAGCPAGGCVGGDCTLTQSLDTVTNGDNQIACADTKTGNTTENGWARCYNLVAEGVPVGQNLTINSVTFGVEQLDGASPINVDVVLYLDTDGCPPDEPGVDASEIARESIQVSTSDVGNFITVEFPGGPVVPAGSDLIVEIENVDDGTELGFAFRTMSNANGQCGPSYLRAADCGLAGWTDLADIDFPDAHLIQVISATVGGTPSGACCFDDESCQILDEAACNAGGGTYQGNGTGCEGGICNIIPKACGPGAGSCDEAHPEPGCDDEDCCAAVCDINPACCSVGWDALCVQIASKLTECLPEPGTCEAPFDTTITQNVDAVDVSVGGVACADVDTGVTTENSWARAYDLSLDIPGQEFTINCVGFGAQTSDSSIDLLGTITIYEDTNGGEPGNPDTDLVMLGFEEFTLLANTDGTVFSVPFDPPVVAPADSTIVVAMDLPSLLDMDGDGFAVYSGNSAGESRCTYLLSEPCVITTYTCAGDLGPFGDLHWLQILRGNVGGGLPCPWDLNDSGDVGILDLLTLLAAWGPCPAPCPPDFDGGGTVDIFDLLTLIANWGACP